MIHTAFVFIEWGVLFLFVFYFSEWDTVRDEWNSKSIYVVGKTTASLGLFHYTKQHLSHTHAQNPQQKNIPC